MEVNKVTFQTKDKVVISKKESTLLEYFKLFQDLKEEFPQESEEGFPILITSQAWTQIYRFVKFLHYPETKEEWISMIRTAEYLQLEKRYQDLLIIRAWNFATRHGATFVNKPETLEQVRKKIEDPNYKDTEDLFCRYRFTRGKNAGKLCGRRVVENGYCEECVLKKTVTDHMKKLGLK